MWLKIKFHVQIHFLRPNFIGLPSSSCDYIVVLCENRRKDFLNYSWYVLFEHDREWCSLGPLSLQMNSRVR